MTEETIEVLNEMITTCHDGAEGFREAAERVDQPNLKSLLTELSTQRRNFVAELKHSAGVLGVDLEDEGSVAGKLHRGWLKLREAVSSRDTHAILAECERGEDHALEVYNQALSKLTDPVLGEVVRAQSLQVQMAHNRVRDLRDAHQGRESGEQN